MDWGFIGHEGGLALATLRRVAEEKYGAKMGFGEIQSPGDGVVLILDETDSEVYHIGTHRAPRVI